LRQNFLMNACELYFNDLQIHRIALVHFHILKFIFLILLLFSSSFASEKISEGNSFKNIQRKNQEGISYPIVLDTDTESSVAYPQLTFVYDWRSKSIDLLGHLFFSGWRGLEIDNDQKNELQKKLPQLIAVWDQQAPILFDEIFSMFHCGFKQKERTAVVSLGGTGGYGSSHFLWLGLHFLLDSETWDKPGSKEDYFTILVFHELLHIWVDDNIVNTSVLLTKYKDEHEYTKEHIHLMALQKMVYLKFNYFDALEIIDNEYRNRALPSYQRAWEIVNDIEGYEVVIQDILDRLNTKSYS